MIDQHPELSSLRAQYLNDLKQLAQGDMSENPKRTGRSHRQAPGTETLIRVQEELLEPYEPPPYHDEPAVSPWLDYFRKEPAFLIHLDPAFDYSKLKLVTSATEDLHTLWKTHTTCLPTVVPTAACWRERRRHLSSSGSKCRRSK
ncbi:hypothetical protein RBB50_012813 [Rhinocladiella similis]